MSLVIPLNSVSLAVPRYFSGSCVHWVYPGIPLSHVFNGCHSVFTGCLCIHPVPVFTGCPRVFLQLLCSRLSPGIPPAVVVDVASTDNGGGVQHLSLRTPANGIPPPSIRHPGPMVAPSIQPADSQPPREPSTTQSVLYIVCFLRMGVVCCVVM